MNVADELKKVQDLHQCGELSDAEFTRAKEAILRGAASVPPPPPATPVPPVATPLSPEAREQQTRQWAMFIPMVEMNGQGCNGGLVCGNLRGWNRRKGTTVARPAAGMWPLSRWLFSTGA